MTGSPPHDSLPHKQQELAAVRQPVHRQCSATISLNINATTPNSQLDVLCILSPAKEASRPSKREGVLSCSVCLSKARQNASASLQKGCFQAPSLLERFPPTCFFQLLPLRQGPRETSADKNTAEDSHKQQWQEKRADKATRGQQVSSQEICMVKAAACLSDRDQVLLPYSDRYVQDTM